MRALVAALLTLALLVLPITQVLGQAPRTGSDVILTDSTGTTVSPDTSRTGRAHLGVPVVQPGSPAAALLGRSVLDPGRNVLNLGPPNQPLPTFVPAPPISPEAKVGLVLVGVIVVALVVGAIAIDCFFGCTVVD